MMSLEQPNSRRSQPLLDALGKNILEGRDAAAFLWQVPDDAATRVRIGEILAEVREASAKKGRREMPNICDELLAGLDGPGTPQQAELMQDGFDRLYKLWEAAKSGMM